MPAPTSGRACAYCGDGATRLTREHAWPRWLRQEIGETLEPHVAAEDGVSVRQWRSPLASVTVKQVCARCNNGWMSRAEVDTEPVLRPLLRNSARELSRDDQHVLAFWALKTATACDLATEEPAAPAELRRELVDASDLPHGLLVLIARYAGRRYPVLSGGWVRPLEFEIGGSRTPVKCLQLTVSVGCVVFQVFGHGVPGLSAVRPAGLKRDFAQVIWPPAGVVYWPLPRALGDDGCVSSRAIRS